MTIPNVLAATWSDGLFVFAGETRRQELAGHSVRALVSDQNGCTLAIVDGHSLCRRTCEGVWSTIASSQLDLACLMIVDNVIYLGTDDARVLRLNPGGGIDPLNGFESMPGRATWYAGSALINGQLVGPPLGVRSMTATSDGAVLLANVHVGGIPRSTDGGVTWQPTIDVHSDVHEVCGHPIHSRTIVAAAATGLCISRDGGGSWTVEQDGLHAPYCSAVAFSGSDILVAASTDHFAAQGAIYRRPMDGSGPLQPVRGLPRWLEGIVDTGCIATHGSALAIADKAGNLYASADAGHTWLHRDRGLPMVSTVLVI
ncbi:MAG: hypothetical protein JWM95_3301 [Gemmatimonadetes bacterium]|nr:hypothetical protein [Gemmatimonadota bacterium]